MTALWNTNAFWAYIVTVKLFKLHWEPRRLSAVVLATAGAIAVVYGGSTIPETPDEPKAGSGHVKGITSYRPATALVGDVLTLVAAIMYGIYQVMYKMYATLPGDPEAELDGVDAPSPSVYEPIPGDIQERIQAAALSTEEEVLYPPPFALFPNLLTSAIGVCTFLFLWVPMPFFQLFGLTTYHFPANMQTTCAILGIALSGLVFNAGFMVSKLVLTKHVAHFKSLCLILTFIDPTRIVGTNLNVYREFTHDCSCVHLRHHLWRSG